MSLELSSGGMFAMLADRKGNTCAVPMQESYQGVGRFGPGQHTLDELRRIKDLLQHKDDAAWRAIELLASHPGEQFTFDGIAQAIGDAPAKLKSNLAHLSMDLPGLVGRDKWPFHATKTVGGRKRRYRYSMDATTAEQWVKL